MARKKVAPKYGTRVDGKPKAKPGAKLGSHHSPPSKLDREHPDRECVTDAEAADMAALHPHRFREFVRLGVIPFVEFGERTRRYRRQAILDFIASRERTATPPRRPVSKRRAAA